MMLIENTPQPINGIKIAIGEDVESIIKASFCLDIANLSKSDWNTGPTINGVPRSEKKITIPPNHALICAEALFEIYFTVDAANAIPPPEYFISLTNPPINTSNTSTLAL